MKHLLHEGESEKFKVTAWQVDELLFATVQERKNSGIIRLYPGEIDELINLLIDTRTVLINQTREDFGE